MEKTHYDIVVKGKVQGVWFRKYTKDKADELEIKGFVKNEFNRTVFISAEGTKESLDRFIDWLYKGSPLSGVSEVVFGTGEFQNYSIFEIRRTKA
jgi:acylphosphatase